jgi:hypothetical protein
METNWEAQNEAFKQKIEPTILALTKTASAYEEAQKQAGSSMPYARLDPDERGYYDLEHEDPENHKTIHERHAALTALFKANAAYIESLEAVAAVFLDAAKSAVGPGTDLMVVDMLNKAEHEKDRLEISLRKLRLNRDRYDDIVRFRRRRADQELGTGWVGSWLLGEGGFGQVHRWVSSVS